MLGFIRNSKRKSVMSIERFVRESWSSDIAYLSVSGVAIRLWVFYCICICVSRVKEILFRKKDKFCGCSAHVPEEQSWLNFYSYTCCNDIAGQNRGLSFRLSFLNKKNQQAHVCPLLSLVRFLRFIVIKISSRWEDVLMYKKDRPFVVQPNFQ